MSTMPGASSSTCSMPQKQPPARIATSRGPFGVGGFGLAETAVVVSSTASSANLVMQYLRVPGPAVTGSLRRRDDLGHRRDQLVGLVRIDLQRVAEVLEQLTLLGR